MGRLVRFVSRISIRLLAFNILLVFLPALGLLSLENYERTLLEAQERAMVQTGRVLAAALSDRGALDPEEAGRILVNLQQQQAFRLRVVDANGVIVSDTSRLGPRSEGERTDADSLISPAARKSLSYRIGLFFYRAYETLTPPPQPTELEPADVGDRLSGRAVERALAGRYGSDTRLSPGSRSMTLYSGLPIFDGDDVVGAVVVSRSTFRILQALYDFRISVVEAVLLAMLAAAVLSLLVSTTIARPLHRLRRDAQALLDRRGRLRRRFKVLDRQDEIGDLSRALFELTHRLEEHQRFMESFASDVSHEFKNPLAAIRNATELLADLDDPTDRERFVTMILDDVARLEQLLSRVREVTQIDADIEHESVDRVRVVPLVRDLLDRLRLRAPRGVTYRLVAEDAEVAVIAAPLRLHQVFENLLDNATSFSPDDGVIDIVIGRTEDVAEHPVRVVVRDRGPGLADGQEEAIFKRFFTYRPDGTRGEHGHTGLGLAIVKAIVESYGGSVQADNALGGGARFTVELPAA